MFEHPQSMLLFLYIAYKYQCMNMSCMSANIYKNRSIHKKGKLNYTHDKVLLHTHQHDRN